MIVILSNIRSKHNVGSIFRTSDAIGVDKIYLCGITPSPIDKYHRKVQAICKVSLGAEKNMAWEKAKNINLLLDKLKRSGFKILALEQSAKSRPYYKFKLSRQELDHVALILGSEVNGLPESVLKKSDQIIEIPMSGKKESLNVSVAYGIVAFSLKYSKIK